MTDASGWSTRTGASPSDLVREMYLAALEGAPLWQLPLQVTDRLAAEQVVRGPFDVDDCSAVLLRWFDAGLIECVRLAWVEIDTETVGSNDRSANGSGGEHEYLARDEARTLLANGSRWVADGPDADVDLLRSDAAEGTTFADWFEHLDGLPTGTIGG